MSNRILSEKHLLGGGSLGARQVPEVFIYPGTVAKRVFLFQEVQE